MTRKKKLSELHDYLFIALAMFIGSAGWVLFLLPNHITLGGLRGIRHSCNGFLLGNQLAFVGCSAANIRLAFLY